MIFLGFPEKLFTYTKTSDRLEIVEFLTLSYIHFKENIFKDHVKFSLFSDHVGLK